MSEVCIAINTTIPPFDNVLVRQALNHAIDKQRIVQLLSGRAVATQILPTGPVLIEGEQPGDTLDVEILDLQHKGWGWNGAQLDRVGLPAAGHLCALSWG